MGKQRLQGRKDHLRIAFVHPDLGIGGAERLIVDAAVGLQSLRHSVQLFTSHHSRNHCFVETIDGTLPSVTVVGDWLPTKFLSKGYIFFAALRGLLLALWLVLFGPDVDVFVVDQLSYWVPILKLKAPVLFYCHFPDKLLVKPGGALKSLYRRPFDLLEEITTLGANRVVVNSRFTAGIFQKSFSRSKKAPEVVYPCFNSNDLLLTKADTNLESQLRGKTVFVSINRFEAKKNVALALKSFISLWQSRSTYFKDCVLVLAGGYDSRVEENVFVKKELEAMREEAQIPSDQVLIMTSISSETKVTLLKSANIVIYTPENEHFGIVPVEAMAVGTPVLATNTGGPLETVVPGKTGWLRPSDEKEFAAVMRHVAENKGEVQAMSIHCKEWAQKFSIDGMAKSFENNILDITKN